MIITGLVKQWHKGISRSLARGVLGVKACKGSVKHLQKG
jgi:hypothetical protein